MAETGESRDTQCNIVYTLYDMWRGHNYYFFSMYHGFDTDRRFQRVSAVSPIAKGSDVVEAIIVTVISKSVQGPASYFSPDLTGGRGFSFLGMKELADEIEEDSSGKPTLAMITSYL